MAGPSPQGVYAAIFHLTDIKNRGVRGVFFLVCDRAEGPARIGLQASPGQARPPADPPETFSDRLAAAIWT